MSKPRFWCEVCGDYLAAGLKECAEKLEHCYLWHPGQGIVEHYAQSLRDGKNCTTCKYLEIFGDDIEGHPRRGTWCRHPDNDFGGVFWRNDPEFDIVQGISYAFWTCCDHWEYLDGEPKHLDWLIDAARTYCDSRKEA